MTTVNVGWTRTEGGAARTLTQMRDNVRAAIRLPVVWEVAHHIALGCAAGDSHSIAERVRAYVARHLSFVRDPVGLELLETPQYLLIEIARAGKVAGDCDDAATLSAALGMAVGIPARFEARAFRTPDAPYSHVVTILEPSVGNPVECDTTKPDQYLPPTVTRRLSVRL